PGDGAPSVEMRHETTGVVSRDDDGSGWKSVAIGSTVLTVIAAAGFGTSWWVLAKNGHADTSDGSFDYSCLSTDTHWRCEHGALLRTVSIGSAIGAGVLATVAVVSFVKSSSGKERPVAGGRSTKVRRELTVTPVVSTSGGGATLRFDW